MNGSLMLLLLFLIPLLTGVTVVYFKPLMGSKVKLLLSFSAAFLLAICFTHLLPEVFHEQEHIGYYILTGFFIQILLEYLSAGIEHGHTHHVNSISFPYLVFLSLCLHSFIEGFALAGYFDTGAGSGEDPHALLAGVLLHKIPIALVFTTLLIEKRLPLSGIITALVIFALTAPLSILSVIYFTAQSEWISTPQLTAVSIGIFLHISTVILFESSKDHQFNLGKFIAIILGVLMAVFSFGTH